MYFREIGCGKTIVFLHGWGCSGDIFLPVAEKLNDHKCYLPDFNGFGRSPLPPKDGWTVLDYACDLLDFFKQNKLREVCIVAHSFGCRVAMVFASQHPELVDKMILVAPAGLRKFSFLRWCKVRKFKIRKFLCRLGLSQNLSSRCGSVDYNACDDEMRNTFVKVVNQDLSSYAKTVQCKTLIVCGKNDEETPLKDAKKLQKLIANSSLAEIDGGHFAFFQTPVAFAKTIRYFEEDQR